MAKEKKAKLFVLDTNVILHDYYAIHNFQENDIVIPIAVIEELDKFKRGNNTLNYNARSFIREMDKITDNRLFGKGIPIGKGKGLIKVEMGHPMSEKLANSLLQDNQDHRILATTEYLTAQNRDRPVILVSKDINLRMKAKALGLQAQDYLSGKVAVETMEQIAKEVRVVKEVDPTLIEQLFFKKKGVDASLFNLEKRIPANQLFLLTANGESKSIAARYNRTDDKIVQIVKQRAYGIEPRNDEQMMALELLLNPEIKLVALTGKAGTGKTLLALAAALAQEQQYEQILLSRPVIPLQNQEMGFLPGDVKEKLAPYMEPLFDNLAVIKRAFKSTSREVLKIEDLLRQQKLLISPLAYIRGRSLSNTFFIVDEAQNLTPHDVKTIITRAGEDTKIVFTGDIYQIDSPYLDMHSNGVSHLIEKMYGQELFAHINLVKGERSKLSELAGKLL